AGSTRPPGRLPVGLARLGALPEGEVQRVDLGLADLDAITGPELFGSGPRELAVTLQSGHPEVDVAVGGVGETPVDQPGGEVDDLLDVLARLGLVVGREHAEAPVCVGKPGAHALCQRLGGLPRLGRGGAELVLDVGDVPDVGEVVPPRRQVAPDDVEGHGAPARTAVSRALGGAAAPAHPHLPRLPRLEVFEPPGQGVVDADHDASVMLTTATAAMPSPWPMKPMPSVVVAVTATPPAPIATASARWPRLASRCGPTRSVP